jgi:hypothetical protein
MRIRSNHYLHLYNGANQGGDYSIIAVFSRVGGKKGYAILPAALKARPGELYRELLAAGYTGNGTANSLDEVKAALAALAQRNDVLTIIDTNGFIGTEAFAFGHEIIPASARKKFVLRQAIESARRFERSGTTEGWMAALHEPCSHSPLMIFVICVAAAAVMLDIFEEGIGLCFHLGGKSGAGKSFLLSVAKSLQDSPLFKGKSGVTPSGDLTAASLEELAARFNHLLLPIDELGAASPEALGRLISLLAYQIRDGRGRTRSKFGAASMGHDTLGFAVAAILNGEKPLAELLGKRKRNLGEIFRLIDILVPIASAGGIFPGVDPDKAGKLFAEASAALQQHHGVVLPRLVEWLIANRAAQEGRMRSLVEKNIVGLERRFPRHGQQRRFLQAFAKVHVAGMLLVHLKLAPFDRTGLDAAIDYAFQRALMAIAHEDEQGNMTFRDHEKTLTALKAAIRDPKQFPPSDDYRQAVDRGDPVKGFVRRFTDGKILIGIDPRHLPVGGSRKDRSEFWEFLDAKRLFESKRPNGPWTWQAEAGRYPRGEDQRPRWLVLKGNELLGLPVPAISQRQSVPRRQKPYRPRHPAGVSSDYFN